MDYSVVLSGLSLAGGAICAVGAWVISVEKRINKVEALKETVDRIDERTERLSRFIAGGDVSKHL